MQNFAKKTKMPKFGTKNTLFGVFFSQNFRKTIVIFQISTLKFVKNECLTHTVNVVGIGSAFSRSVFSEGLGPGPLNEICHLKGNFLLVLDYHDLNHKRAV